MIEFRKLKFLIICALIMFIGLIIFKYIPMNIYGDDIKYDASAHIVWTCFLLYSFWYVFKIDGKWNIPYLIFSLIIIVGVGIQRIIVGAHNLTGLIVGLIISIVSIKLSRKF